MPNALSYSTTTLTKLDSRKDAGRARVITDAPAASPAVVQRYTEVKHPAAQQALMLLRDKQTGMHPFRVASTQLLLLLMIEATRTLPTREESLPWASHVTGAVFAKPLVFLSVGRSALGLGNRVAEFFPNISLGGVMLDPLQRGEAAAARLNLFNAPALTDSRVIVFAPLVVTGTSVARALNVVRRSGAKDISVVTFMTSTAGRETLETRFPDVAVFAAALEQKFERADDFIPGAGDFADRFYR